MFKLDNGLPAPSVVCLLPMLFDNLIKSSGFFGMIILMANLSLNSNFSYERREDMLPASGSIPAAKWKSPSPACFPFFGKDCVDFGLLFEKIVVLLANVEDSHPKVELADTIVEPANPKVKPSKSPAQVENRGVELPFP